MLRNIVGCILTLPRLFLGSIEHFWTPICEAWHSDWHSVREVNLTENMHASQTRNPKKMEEYYLSFLLHTFLLHFKTRLRIVSTHDLLQFYIWQCLLPFLSEIKWKKFSCSHSCNNFDISKVLGFVIHINPLYDLP